MHPDRLDNRLAAAFDADPAERRVVVRAAVDLRDAGRYRETHDGGLTVDLIVSTLGEAPDDHGLVERWNWWMGALEVAHGGFEAFAIRRWAIG